ncbi:MAG: hypothetical protein QXX30_02125 [Candidatus Aenigmatarchaeota archaeon]
MIETIFLILTSISTILCLFSMYFLVKSNIRFTKGEMQKITTDFGLGVLFFSGVVLARLMVEIFRFEIPILPFIEKIFLIVASYKFAQASYRLYKISKVIGFASSEIPKKLKRILKK